MSHVSESHTDDEPHDFIILSSVWGWFMLLCNSFYKTALSSHQDTLMFVCFCRLVKKLEHSWKALVHDGVRDSHKYIIIIIFTVIMHHNPPVCHLRALKLLHLQYKQTDSWPSFPNKTCFILIPYKSQTLLLLLKIIIK